jgi:hypothetical protein
MGQGTPTNPFTIGHKFTFKAAKGQLHNGNYEVRAFIDNQYVAIKFKSKKHYRYSYELQHISFFDVFNQYIKWLN